MMDTLFLTPTELARRWRVTTDHLYREVLGRDLRPFGSGTPPEDVGGFPSPTLKTMSPPTHRVTYHGHAA
jgi:hypothetical protein